MKFEIYIFNKIINEEFSADNKQKN